RAEPLAVGDQPVVLRRFGIGVADARTFEAGLLGKERRRAFETLAREAAHLDAAEFGIFGARDGAGAGFAGGGDAFADRTQRGFGLAQRGFGGAFLRLGGGDLVAQRRLPGFGLGALLGELRGEVGKLGGFGGEGFGALVHLGHAPRGFARARLPALGLGADHRLPFAEARERAFVRRERIAGGVGVG